MKKVKIGSVVKCKIGGPKMIVSQLIRDTSLPSSKQTMFVCTFWDTDLGNFRSVDMDVSCLENVSE